MENFIGECYYGWYSHNDMKEIGRTNIDCIFIIGVLYMNFVIYSAEYLSKPASVRNKLTM